MKSLIFTQSRLGLHRKPFTIFKFKTMVDGKVTRFGSILRATGIDELPQLWNIIKGDMQFIGPRPLTQKDVDRLEWNSSEYDKRFSVRPGMTGFAQLSPICDPKNTLTQDHKTIDEKSAFNVLKIILLSLAIAFLGKKIIKKFL